MVDRYFAAFILQEGALEHAQRIDDEPQFVCCSEQRPVGVSAILILCAMPAYHLCGQVHQIVAGFRLITVLQIAPAIAFGNTCVATPSEKTSVTAWMLTEILKVLLHLCNKRFSLRFSSQTVLPSGVVNIVFGQR